VWHITHRCHKKELLLKFEKDKKAMDKGPGSVSGFAFKLYCYVKSHPFVGV
jgi:hypothetical protein